LTGSQVNLSVMDYNALASTDIDLLAFSDALRTELDADVLTFGQTLDAQVTLPQVVSALASASDGTAATALEHIADRALPRTLLPSRAIDLGPRSSSIRVDAANPVKVNALTLLRSMLLLGNANRQVDLSLASSLPGGSGVNIALMIGEPPVGSPLIAVTDTNDVIVRTAQVRTRVATPLASVHVPVLAELGSASARITDSDCRPNSSAAVSLGVVTSPAMVAIGTVADADFQDMKRPLDPKPARVVKLPLVSVDADAELILSDLNEKRVAFSRSEIEGGQVKTVSSTGLVAGAAKSLSDRMHLDVKVLGLVLNLNALTTAVGETVGLVAPVLDTVLSDLTGLLGVHVGQADARVNALRCGKARLV
jgi:uncharacterized membrane protein